MAGELCSTGKSWPLIGENARAARLTGKAWPLIGQNARAACSAGGGLVNFGEVGGDCMNENSENKNSDFGLRFAFGKSFALRFAFGKSFSSFLTTL